MAMFTSSFWNSHIWGAAALTSVIVILISSLAERRRHRRAKIDDVGFMPWTGITVMAVMVAVIATALAIKTG